MWICMCQDNDCLLKDKCKRFTAKPWMWQSYFTESPRDWKSCKYFLILIVNKKYILEK